MAEIDDILAPYAETQGRGDFPSFLPLPALPPRSEARNYQRPSSPTESIEKMLAEAMYGIARTPYDFGHAAAELGPNIYNRQPGATARNAAELIAMALPIPSAKGLPRTWYHGSGNTKLTGFNPEVGTGSRNAGGAGATFLTPFRKEAVDTYGPNVLAAESRHENPFIWDINERGLTPETLERGRAVFPGLRVKGDAYLDQAQFFDALKRAGFDALETRYAGAPAELAVFDPRKLTDVRQIDDLLQAYHGSPTRR